MNPHNYPELLPKPFRITKRIAKITAVALISLGLVLALPSGAFFPVAFFAFLFTPIGWAAAIAIVVYALMKGYESYLGNPRGFFSPSISPVQSVMLFFATIFLVFAIWYLR